ncbi:tautomerase family protein [Pseudomonas sp. A-RE-26]|uniref:tautomerase family protein n=1 Tax=Pseudomonas sp. A-RE-26 TaxID=2832402 RepID=UPI001CBF587C|nr:tautomerase family protein [Pseudomonas sp. A-RE-26]
MSLTLVKHTGGDPKWVYVLFEDVPSSNWAVAGELFGGAATQRASEIGQPLLCQ